MKRLGFKGVDVLLLLLWMEYLDDISKFCFTHLVDCVSCVPVDQLFTIIWNSNRYQFKYSVKFNTKTSVPSKLYATFILDTKVYVLPQGGVPSTLQSKEGDTKKSTEVLHKLHGNQ